MFDWLLAGPLEDVHRVDPKPLLHCLGCVSCWKVNFQTVLSTLNQVFIMISLYLATFSFPFSLITSPVHAAETPPHCMMLPPPCFIYLYWGEAWVLSLYDQAQIGGVSQWCLSFCKFLPSPDKITQLNQSDHQCLDHLSYQDPSPSIAQFGHGARSRKSPDCFKLHPLRIMKAKSSCEPSTPQVFL